MARTNVRWRRLAIIAVGLAAGFSSMAGRVGAGPAHSQPERIQPAVSRTYVVARGDTLWRIAAQLVGPREDPRPMVGRLIALNRIRDGVIVPGQELQLPSNA